MAMGQLTRREAVALLELVEAARRCADAVDFEGLISSLGALVSFDKAVCGMARFNGAGEVAAGKIVNISYPKEWLSLYEERGFAAVDPVVKGHFSDCSAKIWSDSYLRWGRPAPFVSLAEDFGIGKGYTFGAISPDDSSASIFSLCVHRSTVQRAVAILDFIAPYLHEAFRRVLRAAPSRPPAPLTARETEVIKWIAQGKSTWEISVILGISERTVKFHVSLVMQKLNAVSRAHTVAIAITRGLVSIDASA